MIIADNLGKHYHLGTLRRKSVGAGASFTLRESISKSINLGLRLFKGGKPADYRDSSFWALRNASFEVGRGEVVGLIGRNGAGKSTLLKILSRIVEPTEGIARLHGRVASLLEVGTGFHPELTGRENIYLNGAILGMRKAEITRKFDEIVAFSEVEKFLNTPVKRYSSGMYVRLAFAVAAHLEPEILIVDEVLAVGDHAFQKKCLGKMQDVASTDGRTVLFVSHNMGALAQLCQRGVLLEQGRVTKIGPVRDVIQTYLRSASIIILRKPDSPPIQPSPLSSSPRKFSTTMTALLPTSVVMRL
jgi:lipopolysaccharide transport system ATP-binding protein